MADRWTRGIVGLVLLAAVLHTTTACDGPPREVRIAAAETAGGLAVADEQLALLITARSGELRRELLRMAREGLVASVEAGERWYDERMAPLVTATRVLETAAAALRAIELAADAWEAGAEGGPQAFQQAAACSVAAVAEVPAALVAVGVEVPEIVTQWAPVVAQYALAGCPEPDGGE